MVVVVVSGLPGAGKEELVKVMVENGFSVVRMGDVVRAHAESQGLGGDDLSIGSHATSERETMGKDIWAVRTIEVLPEGDSVIDGCRSKDELQYFRKHIDNLVTVGITASAENRFQRLATRGRADAPKTLEEFKRREERELGWGLGEAIENAQHCLRIARV